MGLEVPKIPLDRSTSLKLFHTSPPLFQLSLHQCSPHIFRCSLPMQSLQRSSFKRQKAGMDISVHLSKRQRWHAMQMVQRLEARDAIQDDKTLFNREAGELIAFLDVLSKALRRSPIWRESGLSFVSQRYKPCAETSSEKVQQLSPHPRSMQTWCLLLDQLSSPSF